MKPNRRAKRTFNQIEKKKEKDKTRAPAVELPEWAPFSNIEHLADTPVAKTAMKGFQHKGASVKFMSEMCRAATMEGSRRHQTNVLAGVRSERRWHGRLRRDLPAVTLRKLHVVVKGKLVYKKFSPFTQFSIACGTNWVFGFWGLLRFDPGFVLPSSFMKWLSTRPKLLKMLLFRDTSAEERELLLGLNTINR